MDGYTHYDLSGASFEEFVDFLFGHEVVSIPENGSGEPEPWYWNAEVVFEPINTVSHYVSLFNDPCFLLNKFSHGQIEQGFWAIQSCNIECSASQIIWHSNIPFVMRADCVCSMFSLFEKLFSAFPSETAAEMWWDSLAYDWHCGNRARENGGEDLQMQDVMFATLEKILSLPLANCQAYALHGLGHLHHPHTQSLIDRYLDDNPDIDRGLRDYARAASRFEVM
jgi:hypothetical protein